MDYDWSSFTVSFEICTSLACVVKLSKYHRINMSSKVYICKLMMVRSHELNAIVFHKDVLEYIYAHNKILCSVMDASCKWVSLAFPGNQWERVWKRRRVCQTIVFATYLRTKKKNELSEKWTNRDGWLTVNLWTSRLSNLWIFYGLLSIHLIIIICYEFMIVIIEPSSAFLVKHPKLLIKFFILLTALWIWFQIQI